MKCDASTLHLVGTLKDLYADKEISTDKRDERKRRDKEEAMRNHYDIQKRKLDIDEANTRSRSKQVELKEKNNWSSLQHQRPKRLSSNKEKLGSNSLRGELDHDGRLDHHATN
jgi:hypothetical protein